MSLYLPDELYVILEKIGWDKSENVADFWFKHRNDISKELFKSFSETSFIVFENQIRWKSDIGQECEKQVKSFLENEVARIKKLHEEAYKVSAQLTSKQKTVNFSNFTFTFNGISYTLNDFQHYYKNCPKIFPNANLQGINLEGIKLHHCIIENVSFAYANLNNSALGATFSNCSFVGTILTNSRLGFRLMNNTYIEGSNLEGARINAVNFGDDALSSKFQYKKVSYLYLLKCMFLVLILRQKHFIEKENQKHTVFISNFTDRLTTTYNKPIKSYINWYEYVFSQLRNFHSLSFAEKTLFTMSLIFTKSWTSYLVLASWALIANLLFAYFYYVIYVIDATSFNIPEKSIIDYFTMFYYSIVTFTTLGYGEITPVTYFTRLLVIGEVLLGYITLGSFVFLIGHKASDRF
ncbi:ion channel [Sulfurimonas sp. C5]|uniref:ion channel n=1 Tax=Sulfurimonas sp. C5 TaxID=3036947 RepID=UPI002457F4EE|nr:ion channel [Sulfurimonas sp. C5]MDH4943528.1 ion channel [Sulfurimonas sp. C5]